MNKEEAKKQLQEVIDEMPKYLEKVKDKESLLYGELFAEIHIMQALYKKLCKLYPAIRYDSLEKLRHDIDIINCSKRDLHYWQHRSYQAWYAQDYDCTIDIDDYNYIIEYSDWIGVEGVCLATGREFSMEAIKVLDELTETIIDESIDKVLPMLIKYDPDNKEVVTMDIQETYEELIENTIYVRNGGWGMNKPDGRMVYAPRFKYIGKCSEYVLFIDNDWSYVEIHRGHKTSGLLWEDERPYICQDKVGVKREGEVLVPPVFDFITPWLGEDVFLAVQDGREMFVDIRGKEVLTRVRRFGEKDKVVPFWLTSDSLDVNTIVKYVGHPIESNPNVVNIFKEWVELDRVCKSEIMSMLMNPDDDLALTEKDLEFFNNRFSYEYSIYQVESNSEHPLQDCHKQLEKMEVFDNTWYYVAKIWQAPGEYLSAAELRAFKRALAKHKQLGELGIAVGHDESLSPGEVRVLFITHYHERCFPPMFEFKWDDIVRRYSICKLREFTPWLTIQVNEVILEEYRDEVYKDLIEDIIRKLKYTSDYSWEQVEEALDYFKSEGAVVKDVVPIFLKQALEAAKKSSISTCTFFLNASIWAINNGAKVNCKKGKTPRDYINELANHITSQVADKLRAEIIQRGGKTRNELTAYEENNTDYWRELDLLRMDECTN